jgi:GGDEF domain-containing protein
LGGDEFVVALPLPVANAPLAVADLSARLERAIAVPVRWNGQLLTIGASIGTALAEAGTEPAKALAEADAAMYARKKRFAPA